MEAEPWDLFNKLKVDDPVFNGRPNFVLLSSITTDAISSEERSRSTQAFANMHTEAGGLDPLATDDDSPPRATEVAQVADDRPTLVRLDTLVAITVTNDVFI